MISINLKPGKKGAKNRAALAGSLARFKALGTKIKDPYRLGSLVLSLAVLGYVGFTQLSQSATLAGLEPKLEQARAENQRFRAFLSEKRRLESVRDSIQAQIATIKNVDGDRYVWAHVLDEVARAVPPYTWLTDVIYIAAAAPAVVDTTVKTPPPPPPVQVQVTGRTVDIQGYTRLLRQLEDSPFLQNVTAVSASTVVDHGRAVTSFVLKATFERPASQTMQAATDQAPPPARLPAQAASVAQTQED